RTSSALVAPLMVHAADVERMRAAEASAHADVGAQTYGAFYCKQDYDSCWRYGIGRQPITPGMHVPNTSSGLGYSLDLDGQVVKYSAQFVPAGNNWAVEGYVLGESPCSPVGGVYHLTAIGLSDCVITGGGTWSYPIGRSGPEKLQIRADGTEFDVN